MIVNKQHRIRRSEIADAASLPEIITRTVGKNALRWYVAQVTGDDLIVESTTYEAELKQYPERVDLRHYPGKSAVLNVVPTGVGCSIGGYAGDAAPVTNLLASTVDYLITHPNTVNASNFIHLDGRNILYTDGCCLDLFCKGYVDLHVPYSNRVGLIVEKTDERSLDTIYNVINTVRAVHGVNIVDCIVTERSIGGRCCENKSGAFVGTIDDPQTLFESCEKLIKMGADSIAITSNISDLPLDNYAKHFAGEYPNPIGGVEAIISYLVTKRFRVPAAHAPLINLKELDLNNNVVDARGAGEMASESGLACILIGLRRAPQIDPRPGSRIADVLNINNLLTVVTPSSCLGGVPTIYAQKFGIPVIAVRENRTILDVTQEKMRLNNVVEVSTYAEATGIVMAMRQGISLESLTRPLRTLRH